MDEYRIKMKELLRKRIYKKWGFQLIYYIEDGSKYGGRDFDMCSAFTWPEEPYMYIGDSKTAFRFCRDRGIKPQTIESLPKPKKLNDDQIAKRLLLGQPIEDYIFSPCCSIGFCEKEQKWYGWSHRAIYGFGIGSKIKKGNCGYLPKNKKDFIENEINFWYDKDFHKEICFEREDTQNGQLGFWIKWQYNDKVPNEKTRLTTCSYFSIYPSKYGKGEWTAESLEDAKQMAINFAKSVS
jgi:hypothetical protein